MLLRLREAEKSLAVLSPRVYIFISIPLSIFFAFFLSMLCLLFIAAISSFAVYVFLGSIVFTPPPGVGIILVIFLYVFIKRNWEIYSEVRQKVSQ